LRPGDDGASEPCGIPQFQPAKIGPAQIRTFDDGFAQAAFVQQGSAKIAVAQIGLGKIEPPQGCVVEGMTGQLGIDEQRFLERDFQRLQAYQAGPGQLAPGDRGRTLELSARAGNPAGQGRA